MFFDNCLVIYYHVGTKFSQVLETLSGPCSLMFWRMTVICTNVCLHVGCICWRAFLYNATRYHSSENNKIFVESSLEFVWDLLGIVGSLVGMAGSLLGVAWDCWEVLEVVGNC